MEPSSVFQLKETTVSNGDSTPSEILYAHQIALQTLWVLAPGEL